MNKTKILFQNVNEKTDETRNPVSTLNILLQRHHLEYKSLCIDEEPGLGPNEKTFTFRVIVFNLDKTIYTVINSTNMLSLKLTIFSLYELFKINLY